EEKGRAVPKPTGAQTFAGGPEGVPDMRPADEPLRQLRVAAPRPRQHAVVIPREAERIRAQASRKAAVADQELGNDGEIVVLGHGQVEQEIGRVTEHLAISARSLEAGTADQR